MSPLDDRRLIDECLAGNKQAWTLLVERYERLIYSIPLRYGLGESLAADIFQEVCLLMLDHLGQLRDESRLTAWIATTTRRQCWKAMGRRDAAGESEAETILAAYAAPDDALDETVGRWEAWQAVRNALGALDPRCQTLLQRLYYSSPAPSYAELAGELDMPEGSIGPTRARCLKKLHHELGGENYRA